ncbi:putative exoribonuclease II [Forsythia ovata]|uniref:Exoribonuclease II n=1 Tax=Forsythia ovata TaxID=205694 RepID=A0ABD1WIP7_9LAMI
MDVLPTGVWKKIKEDLYWAYGDNHGIELIEKNKSVRVEELVEVDELLRRKHAKEAAEKELIEFVKLLKSAREMPSHSKLAKSSWWTEEKIRHRIESLEAYAIDKHYILPHIHQPSTKSEFQLSVKASEMFHLKPSNTENRGSLPTLQRIPSLNPSQNLKHKKFKMSSTLCRWSCFQRLLVGLFEGNAGRNGGIYGPTNFYSMILFSCS